MISFLLFLQHYWCFGVFVAKQLSKVNTLLAKLAITNINITNEKQSQAGDSSARMEICMSFYRVN